MGYHLPNRSERPQKSPRKWAAGQTEQMGLHCMRNLYERCISSIVDPTWQHTRCMPGVCCICPYNRARALTVSGSCLAKWFLRWIQSTEPEEIRSGWLVNRARFLQTVQIDRMEEIVFRKTTKRKEHQCVLEMLLSAVSNALVHPTIGLKFMYIYVMNAIFSYEFIP